MHPTNVSQAWCSRCVLWIWGQIFNFLLVLYKYTMPWKVFRPLDFFHILLRYSLILKWIAYTQSTHNTRSWQCILQMYSKWKKTEISYLHKYSDPLLWDSKLSSGASCFHWSSFLQLIWSTPVVYSIDWTWFEKAHTCLYKVPQLTVHVRAKTKPWGQRNCP